MLLGLSARCGDYLDYLNYQQHVEIVSETSIFSFPAAIKAPLFGVRVRVSVNVSVSVTVTVTVTPLLSFA